jgi:hypothetical protein
MDALIDHEWVRLGSGFDVMLEHDVPCRISNNGLPLPDTNDQLEEEILKLTQVRVRIGHWVPGEGEGELEAPLVVDRSDLALVLRKLAGHSAAIFVDRFNRAIGANDPDWDEAAYHEDFVRALGYCGISWSEVKPQAYYDDYRFTMEQETARLAQLK